MNKETEIKEFLSNLGHYLAEGFIIAMTLILSFIGIVLAFIVVLWLALTPMQWSPWWGLLSVPLTLTVAFSIIMWRIDR